MSKKSFPPLSPVEIFLNHRSSGRLILPGHLASFCLYDQDSPISGALEKNIGRSVAARIGVPGTA
jgi:hypothetical protein